MNICIEIKRLQRFLSAYDKLYDKMVFKNKKGNFVNYKYAKNYQDVSKSLLKKIGVPNQSYNMTYRKKKNNRGIWCKSYYNSCGSGN